MTVHVSERFLNLLRFQLAQFADRDDLRSLVVYVAQASDTEAPSLVPVGTWPGQQPVLEPVAVGSPCGSPPTTAAGCRCGTSGCCWAPCRCRPGACPGPNR